MEKQLGHLRKTYSLDNIDDTNLPESPLELFSHWFDEVTQAGGIEEVNAMTLSTVDAQGNVVGRVVLLKEFSPNGFIFFTNYQSDKCKALFAHAKVSLSFFWPNMERQVIISGIANKTSETTSDTYFSSRPRGSQLGAHVSPQSQPISSRAVLEKNLQEVTDRFEDKEIPRPDHWGGIIVKPHRIEFWQGRPNRLHDRMVYSLSASVWTKQRLAP